MFHKNNNDILFELEILQNQICYSNPIAFELTENAKHFKLSGEQKLQIKKLARIDSNFFNGGR